MKKFGLSETKLFHFHIGNLIAGRGAAPSRSATTMCSQSPIRSEQYCPVQVIQRNENFFKGHYLENTLI